MKIKGMYYSNLFILILLTAISFYILPLFFKRFEEFQKEFKNLLDISDKIVSDIENISFSSWLPLDCYFLGV